MQATIKTEKELHMWVHSIYHNRPVTYGFDLLGLDKDGKITEYHHDVAGDQLPDSVFENTVLDQRNAFMMHKVTNLVLVIRRPGTILITKQDFRQITSFIMASLCNGLTPFGTFIRHGEYIRPVTAKDLVTLR